MRLREWEDVLEIRAWGNWARWSPKSEVGLRAPGWTQLYRPRRRSDAPTLDDDHGLRMDGWILQAGRDVAQVAVLIHCRHVPHRIAAKALGISRRQINNHRWTLVEEIRAKKKMTKADQ